MLQGKAVFLDLQGTLGGDGLGDIREFAFYPFSGAAIRRFNKISLPVLVVTNQSHIAKGDFTLEEFHRRMDLLNAKLSREDARLDGVYCCPHGEEDHCSCRKPQPGLLLRAEKDWKLDLSRCSVVGDAGAWDITMARSAGCNAILVRTGLGAGSLGEYRHLWAGLEADFVAENVLEASGWIFKLETGRVPDDFG